MIVRNYLLGGHFFLPVFLHLFFSHKIKISIKMVPKMDPKGDFWELFSEKVRESESAFRLHRRVRIACEPSSWNAQGDSKLRQKTNGFHEPFFSTGNLKIDEK